MPSKTEGPTYTASIEDVLTITLRQSLKQNSFWVTESAARTAARDIVFALKNAAAQESEAADREIVDKFLTAVLNAAQPGGGIDGAAGTEDPSEEDGGN